MDAEPDDADDRLDGPGWRDHLEGDPNPYDGEDRLPLGEAEHERARRVWHQALTWYMTRYGGDSVNSLAGNMGWFDLRLTVRETDDLFESAAGDPKDPIVPSPRQPKDADEKSTVWKTTKEWAKRGRPRGASEKDLLVKLPTVLVTTTSKFFGALTALGVVAAVVGVKIGAGTPEARLAAAALVWVGLVALAISCLRDQGDLTAAALAWPRLAAYRPRRWEFEQERLRSSAPYALMATATIGLAVAVFWTLKSKGKLPDVPWQTARIVAAVLAGLTVLMYWLGRRRTARLWKPVAEELERRRPEGERGPRHPPVALPVDDT